MDSVDRYFPFTELFWQSSSATIGANTFISAAVFEFHRPTDVTVNVRAARSDFREAAPVCCMVNIRNGMITPMDGSSGSWTFHLNKGDRWRLRVRTPATFLFDGVQVSYTVPLRLTASKTHFPVLDNVMVGTRVTVDGEDYNYLGRSSEPPKQILLQHERTGDFLFERWDSLRMTTIERDSIAGFQCNSSHGSVGGLIDTLVSKVSTQTIRGIPLKLLIEFLHWDTGITRDVAIVGGAVRDSLRELPPAEISDVDIVVACDYNELVDLLRIFFAMHNQPLDAMALLTDEKRRQFGMVKVMHMAGDADDLDIGIFKSLAVSVLPADVQRMVGPVSYLYGQSWHHDAATRDLSINALYVDICRRVVFDPCSVLPSHHSVKIKTVDGSRRRVIEQKLVLAGPAVRSNGTVLTGAFWAAYVAALVKLDYGGQFRFFKELVKDCSSSSQDVEIVPTSAAAVMELLNKTAAALEAALKVAGDIQQLADALGVTVANCEVAAGRWLEKMATKLFPRSEQVQLILEKIDRLAPNKMAQFRTSVMNISKLVLQPVAGARIRLVRHWTGDTEKERHILLVLQSLQKLRDAPVSSNISTSSTRKRPLE